MGTRDFGLPKDYEFILCRVKILVIYLFIYVNSTKKNLYMLINSLV